MNENKMPTGKVYENSHMAISLPINPEFLTADMSDLVESTINFWLLKVKAESKFGEYQGKETILTMEINEDGKRYFTLEIRGYFTDMLLNENIDVIVPPSYEEFYIKEAFKHITENYLL